MQRENENFFMIYKKTYKSDKKKEENFGKNEKKSRTSKNETILREI
jgi:hypothetical protein